jgi:hypothetical protein
MLRPLLAMLRLERLDADVSAKSDSENCPVWEQRPRGELSRYALLCLIGVMENVNPAFPLP